jgi:hypothetical protein
MLRNYFKSRWRDEFQSATGLKHIYKIYKLIDDKVVLIQYIIIQQIFKISVVCKINYNLLFQLYLQFKKRNNARISFFTLSIR